MKTLFEARKICSALNDTLWNGNWSEIENYTIEDAHLWTNLVRLNTTHFESDGTPVIGKGRIKQ